MKKNKYALFWKDAVPQPNGIKGKIRFYLRNSILSVASSRIKNNNQNFLRCLYCHYVFDDQVEKFEKILVELKNIGDFITTDQCMNMLNGKEKIKGSYFHLSFDDGFRNIHKNAYPILVKHKVPAITFLPTKFIDTSFNETAKYCLEIAKYKAVIETLKWKDIREMVNDGFQFGSHSRSHVQLSKISNDKKYLHNEIYQSKSDIESKLNNTCKYFAWPFGEIKHVDDKSIKTIGEANYFGCFGAFRGSIIPGATNNLMIPRHHFEVEWPIKHIKYFASGKME